jgi:ribosomal protein S18 acetylase RimI-like enzyme
VGISSIYQIIERGAAGNRGASFLLQLSGDTVLDATDIYQVMDFSMAEKQWSVRRLQAGDGAVYRTIRLAALRGAPEAFGSTYEVEAARDAAQFEQRVLQGCIFAAFCGDRAIGVAGFRQEVGEKFAHKGVLWGMYVEAGWRDQGLGGALVQAVLRHAAQKVDVVTLAVVTDNLPAVALYRRMGFQQYGLEPRALKIDGRYVSETLMLCDLH